jgi:hypothetical protein
MHSSVGDGISPSFRIHRSIVARGPAAEIDPTIKSHLEELNKLLGRRIFDRDPDVEEGTEHAAAATGGGGRPLLPAHLLVAPLTPKHVHGPSDQRWEDDSLVDQFLDIDQHESKLTLAEYIDRRPELSELNYAFDDLLARRWRTLDFTTQAILGADYPAIRDYLVALGHLVMDLDEVRGLANFIFQSARGVASIADYASVSAARTIIRDKALKVDDYDDDDSVIVRRIKKAKLTLSDVAYQPNLLAIVDDFVFNGDEAELIAKARIGKISDALKQQLVSYIKLSPVPITENNVNYFLPLFISQITGNPVTDNGLPVPPEQSEKDFDVEFFEDDRSMVQVSRAAVKCAAQLYYAMVVGDELGVFDVVNYFTHRYLIRGEIEIVDQRLRDDLQNYVFSDRFTDLKTGVVRDRTRPAERHMFYRQTFDEGTGQVTGDVIVNSEFKRLWKVLMLESALYLERAQASPHPDNFVSRQKVMQAVEDCQYNFSTHCTGMANVVTPLIYAELNFVIRRIFMHPEVLRQVVPTGSTWWRVVERLYMEMRHTRPKATVLYNKAKLGHDIITAIAEYEPSTFEENDTFSSFISNVDAFITTQSILQDALTDDLKHDQEDAWAGRRSGTVPELVGVPAAGNGKAPAGDAEWDF